MTEKEKNNLNSALYGTAGGILIMVLGFLMTSMRDDKVATKKDIEAKASIEYVDKKCQETKEILDKSLDDIKIDIREIRSDTKELLRMQKTQ